MTRAWRIVKLKYAQDALDGEGPRRLGSRWASPGYRVIHASQSLSLATLEVLVHLQSSSPLAAYVVFTIDFDDALAKSINEGDLPANWREFPAPAALRTIGDGWIREGASVVHRVPSAIIAHESNYLINPEHPDFGQLQIGEAEPLDVDHRVFRR